MTQQSRALLVQMDARRRFNHPIDDPQVTSPNQAVWGLNHPGNGILSRF